ncbi:hypothetical protein [Rosistilla oblonga]|uniref:hypothetical protein n=1 Tax=Rosistilla oblonga TaxID=2527990 RepID=UPI003A9874D0
MEARFLRSLFVVATLLAVPAFGAGYRTQNFIVQASTPQFAKQVGDAAEQFRSQLAIDWLGSELPPWPAPCPIRVQDAPHLGAGGATEYTPTRRGVRDFRMSIQGSQIRIMDSVLPHEVTHTVLATHFGQPLPRWADEGASTTVEHHSERQRHEEMLREFLSNNRGIPMNQMFMMREYPSDILPLYAQGFSVSRFLIEQGGRRKFVDFVGETLQGSQWTHAVRRHYGYESLSELQDTWLAWVANGSGPVDAYVKNRGPAAADVAQVAAVAPTGDMSQSNGVAQIAAATPSPQRQGMQATLASADGSGWYMRRRQEVAAGEVADPEPSQNFNKKSIRDHGLARPQAMQTIAPQGVPWGPEQGTVWR